MLSLESLNLPTCLLNNCKYKHDKGKNKKGLHFMWNKFSKKADSNGLGSMKSFLNIFLLKPFMGEVLLHNIGFSHCFISTTTYQRVEKNIM